MIVATADALPGWTCVESVRSPVGLVETWQHEERGGLLVRETIRGRESWCAARRGRRRPVFAEVGGALMWLEQVP